MMSAKNGGVQTPPCRPKSEIGLPPSRGCKKPGKVVALLQGNFLKIINSRKFLRKKSAVLLRLKKYPLFFFFLNFMPIICQRSSFIFPYEQALKNCLCKKKTKKKMLNKLSLRNIPYLTSFTWWRKKYFFYPYQTFYFLNFPLYYQISLIKFSLP